MAFIGVTRGPEWYYVGQDNVVGFFGGNTLVETEVLDYVIPPDTVLNGIIITVWFSVNVVGDDNVDVRIKAGTDGVEITRVTIRFTDAANLGSGELEGDKSANGYQGGLKPYQAVIDDLDWTQAQSVSITGQFDGLQLANTMAGTHLLIMGF